MIETIVPKAPFDFDKMLRRLESTGKNKIAVIDRDRLTFRRAIRLGSRAVPIHVASTGTVDSPRLELRLPEHLSAAERAAAAGQMRTMFSADVDLGEFYRHFAGHPQMEPIIRRFYGLRLVTEPDLFETMVKTIIGQQLNLKFAAALIDRLVALCGEETDDEDGPLAVFPVPEDVAALTADRLRELQFSQRKAEYIIGFAREVAEGHIELDKLQEKINEEIIEILMRIRGIGRWSVECMLLFGMGRTNLLPAADIGLRNAIRKAWHWPHQPTEAEVRMLGADWAPWQSYATYYLWESLSDSGISIPGTTAPATPKRTR